MNHRPPLIPRLLLHILLRGEEREVICGDLEEEYADLAAQRGGIGRKDADRWYWRQTWKAVGGRSLERVHRIRVWVLSPMRGSSGDGGFTGMRTGGGSMRELWQDLRFGLRALARRRTFTAVAGLTLALGVGANTAMFSVLDSVLFKPLDYPEPDRIVQVWSWRTVTKSTLVDVERSVSSFSSVSGYIEGGFALTGDGAAEEFPGARVSPAHFTVLGIQPALGRGFSRDESVPGRDDVAILSHELWSTRYAADPGILGRSIVVDGNSVTVVGVMPEGYHSIRPGWRLWVPLTIDASDLSDFDANSSTVLVARMKPGATTAQADAELASIAQAIRNETPDVFGEKFMAQATAIPLLDARVDSVRTTLWLLMGGVGLVLLIACANVANLLLAQGSSRTKEMAVRQSQGATRGRLIRQMLTESALLGILGGALGVMMAITLLFMMQTHLAGGVPRADTIVVDYRVLLFASGTSLLTAMIFGLIPALRASGSEVSSAIKEGGRRGARRSRRGMNQALVGLEIALSLVLLAGAGLLLKSSWRLQQVDPGFRTENVLLMRVTPPAGQYAESEVRAQYYRDIEEQVGAVPGVVSVGSAWFLPMTPGHMSTLYEVKDRPRPEGAERSYAMAQVLTPGVLEALDLPLLRGRWIEDSDLPDAPWVGVINEKMAREAFGTEDPIGREVQMFGYLWFTVVGIVADMHQYSPDLAPRSEVYFSTFQIQDVPSAYLTIRTQGDPAAVVPAVREALARVDADVPVSRIATMEELLARTTSDSRLTTMLFSLFAGIALLLGAVGVYGVVSHTVSERTYEIGVRMALGARKGIVVREVVRSAAIPIFVGLVVGAAGAVAATRLLSGLLFEVEPSDPTVLIVVTAVLACAAMVACVLPARRAALIDPARCLNTE